MSDFFKGNCAVVTGGGTSISAAVAHSLAKVGAKVALIGNDPKASKVVDDIKAAGGEALFVKADLTDPSAAEKAASTVEAAYGAPTVLVNYAGGSSLTPTSKLTDQEWRSQTDHVLKSNYLSNKSFLPGMIAKGTGSIVNVTTVHGVVGEPGSIAPSSAEGGVLQLSRVMAWDYAPNGLRVNAVMVPITIADDANGSPDDKKALAELHALERLASAEEIATTVVFMASDQSSYTTGSSVMVDGGYTRAGAWNTVGLV